MRHKNILLFIFLLLLNNVSLISQTTNDNSPGFSISASVSTNKIPINKKFKVTLEIKITGNMQEYIISSPFIDKMHNMEITGTASENTTIPTSVLNNVISVKKYIYTLKPSSIGMAYFPKVLVSITDKKTGELISQLDTPAIPVEILEPLQKKDYKFLYIIIAVLIILSLIILIYIKYKNSLNKIKEIEDEVKEISVEEKYFEFIEKEKMQDRLNKEKINVFVKLLKGYIEEKYDLKIKNKSSKEIIGILSKIEISGKEKIINVLKETDLIKYALEEPDNIRTNKIIEAIIEIIKTGGANNE